MLRRRLKTGSLMPILALALPCASHAQEIGVGMGVSQFSGRFGGTERSEIHSVHISLNAAHKGWRADLTLPYLRVAGAGGIDVGGIVIPIEGLGPSEGVGDLTLRATRSLPESLELPVACRSRGR
jgi:hypothetical protein